METILFLTRSRISQPDLLAVVNNLGGKWNDDPTLDHGVIQNGAATVYVNRPRAPSTEYSEEEIAELSIVLKGVPMELMSIDVGHGNGSLELARQVAITFLDRWDGMVDGNNVIDSMTRVT